MSQLLFLDCHAGISGDMLLGAFVDLGVPAEHLIHELSRLPLANEFRVRFEPGLRGGIAGTRAMVELTPSADTAHRSWKQIRELLQNTPYPEPVRQMALAIFTRLAEVEATIHAVDVESVHFHEVGATDSIVDIIGIALCMDYLQVQRVLCSTVELGSGFVECAHGRLTVPVPATLALLQDVPVHIGGVTDEATTPTGAAALSVLVDEYTSELALQPSGTGYGLGGRDGPVPNVLRMILGTSLATADAELEHDQCQQIETDLDDLQGEAIPPLMAALMNAGALDVTVTPQLMKKGRPGHRITVLAPASHVDAVCRNLFACSSTIGLRMHTVQRRMLRRELLTIDTQWGPVGVKRVRLPGGAARWKLEHDDVERIAGEQNTPYLRMRQQLETIAQQQLEADT